MALVVPRIETFWNHKRHRVLRMKPRRTSMDYVIVLDIWLLSLRNVVPPLSYQKTEEEGKQRSVDARS